MYIKIDLWEKQNKKSLWQLLTALKVRAESVETHPNTRPSTSKADHQRDSEGCLGNWGLFYLLLLISRGNERLTFRQSRVFGVYFERKKKCNKLRGISPVSGFYLHITLITWSCLWGVKSSQWKHSVIRLREYKTLALHCPDQARKALVYFFSFVCFLLAEL